MVIDQALSLALLVFSAIHFGAEAFAHLPALHSAVDELGHLSLLLMTAASSWLVGLLINLQSSYLEKRWPGLLHPIRSLRAACRRGGRNEPKAHNAFQQNTPPAHRFHS
jgi:hypothetical protein